MVLVVFRYTGSKDKEGMAEGKGFTGLGYSGFAFECSVVMAERSGVRRTRGTTK